MSDLISRSELIKALDKYCGSQRYLVSENIREIINNQSTAYDIDKVIEELEERKEEGEKQYKRASMEDGSYMLSKCFSEGARAYGNAIEIVKQDVVSDDVCEWKRRTDDNFLHTSCNNRAGAYSDEFKYCPYCGKKMKVVE